MIINLNKLLHLPVYTESGIKLGKIYELEIDAGVHMILRYLVRPNIFSTRCFLIKNTQVKDIAADRVIVYDEVIKQKAFGEIIPESGKE